MDGIVEYVVCFGWKFCDEVGFYFNFWFECMEMMVKVGGLFGCMMVFYFF